MSSFSNFLNDVIQNSSYAFRRRRVSKNKRKMTIKRRKTIKMWRKRYEKNHNSNYLNKKLI